MNRRFLIRTTLCTATLAALATNAGAATKKCSVWPSPTTGYNDTSYMAFSNDAGTATEVATASDYTDPAQYNAELYFVDLIAQPAGVPGYESNATYFAKEMGMIAADSHWKKYDFGWEDWGNPNKAVARTLNAFAVIWSSHLPAPRNWTDQGTSFLDYALGYVGRNYKGLNDLRAGCTSSEGKSAYTRRDFVGVGDEYTEVYQPFFFRSNAIRRASTLAHEARHRMANMGHTSGDKDGGWWDNGYITTYAFQVSWLATYYTDANSHTFKTYRNWAKYGARDLMAQMFVNPSTIPEYIRTL